MGISLEIVQGTSRDFPLQITNPDGSIPVGIFQPTDSLSATIWQGANETPLLTPVSTWIDATNAQYQVIAARRGFIGASDRAVLHPSVCSAIGHANAHRGSAAQGAAASRCSRPRA